jgi:hypothetical protein
LLLFSSNPSSFLSNTDCSFTSFTNIMRKGVLGLDFILFLVDRVHRRFYINEDKTATKKP